MADKKKSSGSKGKKKGGFGGKLLVFVVLVGAGIGATWYLQPELVEQQIAKLRELIGV